MADLLDKAILIGIGLEKKAKEVLGDLQQAGKEAKASAAGSGAEPLTSKEMVENKVVEEGVKALSEFLNVIRSVKSKIESEVQSSSGKVFDKLHIATEDDIEVVREMARIAREKVDSLEKRVEELEARLAR
ncbi:MAG: accessory factor UbiK family protein [Deltaproteobacteria bacterium]